MCNALTKTQKLHEEDSIILLSSTCLEMLVYTISESILEDTIQRTFWPGKLNMHNLRMTQGQLNNGTAKNFIFHGTATGIG